MSKTFIIGHKAGMQNGSCLRFRNIYRVGASNQKQALEFIRKNIDPTGSYKVFRQELDMDTPKGAVTNYYKNPKPVIIEHNGRNYLQTEEYNDETKKTKYVDLYARGNKPTDIIWL